MENADVVVIGAGLRGLGAALRVRRGQPERRLVVVEVSPGPGGSVRTLRTNGFVCETGPFAFDPAEVGPLLDLLPRPPRAIAVLPAARTGHLVTANGLLEAPLSPAPISFATGTEELVQACRRELGGALRLGRAATGIAYEADAFRVTLGGEVPALLVANEVALALPLAEAARLLAPFDPGLGAAGARLVHDDRAFAFFGGLAAEAPELTGYGFAPGEGIETGLAEVLCCHQVFPGRARQGLFLLRAELAAVPPGTDDEALLASAATEVRRWTGTRAAFGFTKLHRFAVERRDGAWVECRTRLRAMPQRLPGLTVL